MAGTYTVTIRGRTYKIIPVSDNQVEVDGVRHFIDFVPLNGGSFSLILDGKAYSIDKIQPQAREGDDPSGDGERGNTVSLSVRGKHFVARVDDDHSLLVRSLFAKPRTASGIHVIRAPMPGLISRIEVRIGEEVASGKGLFVLEAMKMENEIRSTKHGRVQTIHVEKGKPVEKGEALVTLELL